MEWSEETIAQLRALWAEGHSTAEIGRRMGISKNAVVGKAHRLSLSSRPSPIRRGEGGPSRRAAARRVSGPTLPPLRTAMTALPAARPAIAAPRASVSDQPGAAQAAQPRPVAEPVSRPALRPVPPPRTGSLRPQPCCWPIGEPGTRSFRFCDAEATPGKPYCAEHVQLAYVRVKDRREDAA